jgi:hypothetical protein
LKSICKVINARDSTVDAYVIGNAQRPLLSYGVKNVKASRRTFLYVEALKRFEAEAKEIDLTEAYRRARPAFTGKLERTFIILKDGPEDEPMVTGSNAEPVSTKN